jgi:PadR family transcriptional regulator PadR
MPRKSAPAPPKSDLLQGTLDLLILRTLVPGPLHGWAVSKRIQQMSKAVLTVNQGSLYPALYRLEDRGWISGVEGESPEGRRIKIYRLTAAGHRQLGDELQTWNAFSAAINHVIEGA